MQSPFDEQPPHPLAQAAAQELMATLPVPAEGKMFGVLVVRGGAVLKAFSAGANALGWAPHVFDVAARAELEPAADALVKSLTARLEQAAVAVRQREAAARELEVARESLRATHAERRRLRREQQRAGGDSAERLDEESRADGRDRRTFEGTAQARLAAFAPAVRHHAAVERLRRIVSREAMKRLHDTYVFHNVRGERATLRELFAGSEPPWGAGECAAVKLVAHALRSGLEPQELAEFWWGPPPAGGGRMHGTFYPACRPKCGPVLPFLLRGLEVDAVWPFTVSAPLTELEMLWEDPRFVALSKPAGLLSVPGKSERDCVIERLRERHPGSSLVHRLDLDTSGVLLAALDPETHRALQRQFLMRTVAKRYVAWVDGALESDQGTITLPLRVNLDQRPRQLVCFEHGKAAVTRWHVLERAGGRTKVAFFPETGRTHQLRVHASHPQGLGAAIVGDNLYGKGGPRLMLHAESLTFDHPQTGQRMTLSAPAPF